jgi:hypothetical protein
MGRQVLGVRLCTSGHEQNVTDLTDYFVVFHIL